MVFLVDHTNSQMECNWPMTIALLWIRDIWVRIRIRGGILLFSSVADKMPTKNKFVLFLKVLFIASVFKSKKKKEVKNRTSN